MRRRYIDISGKFYLMHNIVMVEFVAASWACCLQFAREAIVLPLSVCSPWPVVVQRFVVCKGMYVFSLLSP